MLMTVLMEFLFVLSMGLRARDAAKTAHRVEFCGHRRGEWKRDCPGGKLRTIQTNRNKLIIAGLAMLALAAKQTGATERMNFACGYPA